MKRPEVKSNMILGPLLGDDLETNLQSRYEEAIQKFEIECEKEAIDVFKRLSIHAIVKTDRYSLPWNEEITVQLPSESWLNGAYEFHRILREIVKELLNKDILKIRFYMYIEVFGSGGLGRGVQYKFRYHTPNNQK